MQDNLVNDIVNRVARWAETRLGAYAVFLILPLITMTAMADEVSFSTEIDGKAASATSETSTRNGVDYIPIASVARRLGIGVTVGEDRLQVDFQNRSALVKYSEREVNASTSQFSLSRPVIRSGGEAWMAVEDVEPFFRNAFRLSVQQRRPEQASDPNALDALEPLDTEAAAPPGQTAALPPAQDTPLEPLNEEELLKATPSTPAPVPPSTQGPVIVIDPGHGGSDSGIAGRTIAEKDLSLAVALKLKSILEKTPGLAVRLTREDDRELSVLDRINFAIANRGRLLVSIHAGSSLSPSANGSEIYYPTDTGLTDIGLAGADSVINVADRRTNALQSRRVAEAMAAAMANQSPAGQRGARAIRSRLLHNVPMPSLIVEVGFLTNPTEEAVLTTDEYQGVLAGGIAAGINQYLGLAAPSSEPEPATRTP